MSGPGIRATTSALGATLGIALALVVAIPSHAEPNPYKTPGHADGATPPIVLAKAWVVADAESGAVLAAKNAHERLRPASTLKTLTAVTLLPVLDKQDVYTVEWEDAASIGSAVGIVPDATYTIDELFYGMLLPSGNDAAHALANSAGSVRQTVELMNTEAQQLGATDTTVKNPSGLDAPGQYSSAFDLAVFTQAGLERRDFRRYVGTVTTAFPAEMPKKGKQRKTYQIYNQNPLLLNGYRGTIGVKTGYTTLAGSTFSGAVTRGDHTYIVTLMGLAEPTESAARRLFDWTFKNATELRPLGVLGSSAQVTTPERVASAVVPTAGLEDQDPVEAGGSSPWVVLVVVLAVLGGLAAALRRRARP